MNKNVSNVLNGKTVSVPRKRYGVFKTFFAVRYGNFILTATVCVKARDAGQAPSICAEAPTVPESPGHSV